MATFYEDVLPQTVAVMLLVDNGRLTQNAWSDLCDHCLPSLFERLNSAYPSASFRTLVQESCFTDQNIAEVPPAPREYHTLQDAVEEVRFNATSNCGLSLPLIDGAIQFLSTGAALARHIIIMGSSALHNEYSSSNWYRLAHTLAVGSTHCHLLLHAHAASAAEPLNSVFNETLRLQNLAEDDLWFSNDRSQIIPRLSSIRSSVPQGTPLEVAPPLTHPGPLESPFEHNSMLASQRTQLPAASSAPPSEEGPSLVTQLQQMHGLTKKKVYGSKPKRRPFVSAEVYRDHPRKASSLSPVSPSDTNHGGRVTSPSLIERGARVYQNGSVLPHRSLVDIRSSSSKSELDPVSSYLPPTTSASSPSSPVINQSPSFWNAPVSSLTTQQQQHPTSFPYPHAATRSGTYLTKNNPGNVLIEETRPNIISRGDGGTQTSPSQSVHVDSRSYLKAQNSVSETLIHSMTGGEYSIPPSAYRDEVLSHLGGPSPSAGVIASMSASMSPDDRPFNVQASSVSSDSYTTNTSRPRAMNPYPPDLSSQSNAPWPRQVPTYDDSGSPYGPYDNQVDTVSHGQYGMPFMTDGPSSVSSYPSSPISSGSSSLTGWAG